MRLISTQKFPSAKQRSSPILTACKTAASTGGREVRMRASKLLAYAWASPTSVLGLLFVPDALLTGRVRNVAGVLEVHGRLARFFLTHCTILEGGASAMTLGHVVIARNQQLLDDSRSHERVHVRQCERWGPFFIPAYMLFCLLAWYRGLRAYEDNPFEREAYGETPG
jgi:hypothetical protein